MAEKVRIRDLGLTSEVHRSLVHIERIPEHDGCDNHVEGHGTLLLGRVRSIINPTLGMCEQGFG